MMFTYVKLRNYKSLVELNVDFLQKKKMGKKLFSFMVKMVSENQILHQLF